MTQRWWYPVAVLALLTASSVAAERVRVEQGTNVPLQFVQAVSSKTIKVGDPVKFRVARDVVVDRNTILKRGQTVTGVVSKVDKRKRYGINAQLRIALNPVKTSGGMLKLEPRQKGAIVGGKKSAEAGAATAGGALVLGPIGLVGGYFVVGKEVNIKPGDPLETEVSESTTLRM